MNDFDDMIRKENKPTLKSRFQKFKEGAAKIGSKLGTAALNKANQGIEYINKRNKVRRKLEAKDKLELQKYQHKLEMEYKKAELRQKFHINSKPKGINFSNKKLFGNQ